MVLLGLCKSVPDYVLHVDSINSFKSRLDKHLKTLFLTVTPVDRNKTYCFHKLVLNLPAPLDIQ